jgi:Spy/CpxP family protein refolding chaperone
MDCQTFGSPKWFQAVLTSVVAVGTVFSAVAFSVVSCPALAQAPSSPPAEAPPGRGGDPLTIYREAGVSTEQENQIRTLVKSFETDTTARIDSLRKMLKEMRDLSLQPTPDEAAVLAKQDQINKTQNEIANGRIKLLLKIRAMLSKEQKQKLVDLMQHSPPVNQ